MMFLLLITLISMLLAAIMSVIAWRLAQEERQRSEARVATLAADIHTLPHADLELRHAPERHVPVSSGALFASDAGSAAASPRPWAIAATGVLVFGGILSMVYVASGFSRTTPARVASGFSRTTPTTTVQSASNPQATPSPAAPLELVALGHERDGNRMTVRGVVRNPPSGAAVDRLTAVVFLFGRDGGFLATGRAAIDTTSLGPGGEATFTVTVPGAADVGRYRVSFRANDRVVPHVDRRELRGLGQEKS